MSYQVHNFQTGEVIYAAPVNEMDAQIKLNETNTNGKKSKQTAVSDPTASGTSLTFISTINQNPEGVITPTKKTVSDMGAATADNNGTHGLVPAPAAGKQSSYLRGDGTWNTPTNTKNTAGTTNQVNTKMFIVGATSQAANPTTYSNVNVYIGTDNCLYSNGSKVAPLASPEFSGTPTAPTAADGTNTTQVATTAFVMNTFKANDSMIFKGTIGTGGTVTALPATHDAGWTYKVVTAATYAGKDCEVGDMIICVADGTVASDDDWAVIQSNIDGAVTGPVSSTDGYYALFDGASGKVIKVGGSPSAKADKVSGATNGNFAGLDSNGNLVDSGHKHSDYVTDVSGKADKVSSATNGNFAGLDSNGNLIDSGHKHSDYLTEHQDISGKADKANPVFTGSMSMGRKSGTIIGTASVVLGSNGQASGNYSFCEGGDNKATESYAHAEGNGTTASGGRSHAEGSTTTASGSSSHAEGSFTTASSNASHAEGMRSVASGQFSHAEGYYTIAKGYASHVSGQYNVEDSYDNWPEWVSGTHYYVGDKVKVTTETVDGYVCTTENTDNTFNSSHWLNQYGIYNYTEIVGNGTANNARSNARALDWNGNEYLKGDLYINCNADSTGGNKVATENFVTTRIPTPPSNDGTYLLKLVVSSGTSTYGWEEISSISGAVF